MMSDFLILSLPAILHIRSMGDALINPEKPSHPFYSFNGFTYE
jgi:hypothetical protein